MTTVRSHWVWRPVSCLALASVYFAAAKLGLRFATVEHSVTLVWPPTGLAIASLLLFGSWLWPGVALGAFIANASTAGVPFVAALGMAGGNTAEAVVAALLLRRAGFDTGLRKIADVWRLVFLAAMLSTAISATVGTLSLWLGGVIRLHAVPGAWRVWWLGDMMGGLIVTPLVLGWVTKGTTGGVKRHPIESIILVLLLVGVSVLVFGEQVSLPGGYGMPYAVFPFLIWAALRFGPRGAASANFMIALIAIWHTANDVGPFVRPSLDESLLLVQMFVVIVAVTSLVLGATESERDHAIRVREDFVSIASHELKTPLTPLRLQIQRLIRELKRGGSHSRYPEEAGEMLAVAERQIDRLSALVEELLDLTRLRATGLRLAPQELDLVVLVRETVESLRHEVTVDVDAPEPLVGSWDRLRLQQVIANLLSNALKYGGGKPVRIECRRLGHLAVVSVTDQGPGIAGKDQHRIFARFERTKTEAHHQGLGLGLYIARKIVEAHQGRIGVRSQPGAGATFTVELPFRPIYSASTSKP